MNWGVWGKDLSETLMTELIEKSVSLGINTFDHADIYGGYTTEKTFGTALSLSEINRESIYLISKCGIQYPSENRPLKVKYYDYSTMQYCQKVLKILKIKFETKLISAHRTPNRMYEFAKNAEKNNVSVIIAGAGGSAHLPGMVAALTTLPVLGVPIESKKLKGLDSLLSIAQMPKGIPVGSVAIGKDGAINAALLAASIISLNNKNIKKNLNNWRKKQSRSVKKKPK